MRRYESELSSTASHIVFGYRSCSDLFLRAFQEICVSEAPAQSPKNHSNLYVYTLLCCFCIYCFHRFLEDQGQNEWKRESKGTVLFDSFSLDVGHSESRRTVPIDSSGSGASDLTGLIHVRRTLLTYVCSPFGIAAERTSPFPAKERPRFRSVKSCPKKASPHGISAGFSHGGICFARAGAIKAVSRSPRRSARRWRCRAWR